MAKVYKSLTELIGKTPLMELSNLRRSKDLGFDTGCGYFNPGSDGPHAVP